MVPLILSIFFILIFYFLILPFLNKLKAIGFQFDFKKTKLKGKKYLKTKMKNKKIQNIPRKKQK
jgi:hypothetical protein